MSPERVISRYRLIAPLGAGGTGEVYSAEDRQLGRRVALKLLSPSLAASAESMRRFEHEARAAAALNHPNIAHVYEIGQDGGVHFIAMELVEGTTLAAAMTGGPFPAGRIVDIGRQVAGALEEAHSKGVVHRDIKPANLMLSQRGLVKVLDFGLAKIAPEARLGSHRLTDTITDPGSVMGTIQYMSPEQALGRQLDGRSDIFSLGAVLYELATGRRAFPGDTPAAVFDAILHRTPASPTELNPEVPPELARVIRKAIEKDCKDRYQTASDLRSDLTRLRRDWTPAERGTRRRKVSWKAAGMAGLLAVMAAAVGWLSLARRPGRTMPPLEAVPLTSYPGSESQPAFSPDGSQVAFSWNSAAEDNWDIYVKVLEAGTPLRLTSHPAMDYSPAWSPDGRQIAYLRQSDTEAGFWLVPSLGGLERKLSHASPARAGAESPYIAWLPRGDSMVVADRASDDEPMALFLLSVETGERQRLTRPPAGTSGDSSPAISPDGRRVAFVRTASLSVQDLYVVALSGGEPQRVTTDKRRVYGLTWSPGDGKLLFTSARGAGSRLWRISPEGGAPERIAGIGESASFLAVTRRGDRLAYTRSMIDTNIWRFPLPPGKGEPVLLAPSTRHEHGPRYSPDGSRVVFSSNRSGSYEIWVADSDGSAASQLTSFNSPGTGSPSWSPDGRWIAFDSRPNGNPDTYVVAAAGGTPRRLTTEASEEIVPSWSGDGAWIYFASNRTGSYQVWKMPSGGGPATQLTRNGGFHAEESPDGKWLYYAKSPSGPGLWRMPAAGGAEELVLGDLRAGYWGYWTAAAEGVYYVHREDQEGASPRYSLRLLSLPAGRSRAIAQLPRRPYISGLAVSADRRWFLYSQVDRSDTDIMLVNNFY